MELYWFILALTLGFAFRAIIPYLRKNRKYIISFEKQYIGTMILGFLTSLATLPDLYPIIVQMQSYELGLLYAFLYGVGYLSLYNEILKWIHLVRGE